MQIRFAACAALALSLASCATVPAASPDPMGIATLPRVAEVDPRYQSYNVEMVEVTGGRFWAPYGGPPGEVYRMRPPVDLSNLRLRQLARHLGPAYMRVSGTWANTTYLPAEGEDISAPPKGYRQVLTRDQWRGVVDFAKAADAEIVTSFAVGEGTRDADGVWTTTQAQRVADLTREAGGKLAAAEFFNEPNAAMAGGLPRSYSAADYARDYRIFRDWARKAVPGMVLVGPGSVGEIAFMGNLPVPAAQAGFILSEDMMKANPGSVDVVSYHHYGSVSQRCAMMKMGTAQKDEALSDEWLGKTLLDYDLYARLRDTYEPGKPLWVTETAQAACGGSPWASTFLDSFRYLNQLGALAQKGVKVVMHNTLAASDYALVDEDTLEPRPNYWAAVLWHMVMGTTVLASPPSPSAEVRIYAQCLAGDRKGGVGLLAMNLGSAQQVLDLGRGGESWTLTAQPLDSHQVRINGASPSMDGHGVLHGLDPRPVAGELALPGQSIAFVALPGANNPACH